MVRTLGADHVIDYTQEDFTQSGRKYDLILQLVGTLSPSDLRRAPLSHRDDDLAASMPLFQVPEGLGDLAQRVRPVDDRLDLAGLDELLQELQVIPSWLHEKRAELLAPER